MLFIDLVSARSQDTFEGCPVRADRCSFFKVVLYFLLPAFPLPLCTDFTDAAGFPLELNSFVWNRFDAVLLSDFIGDFLDALVLCYGAVILLPILGIEWIRIEYDVVVQAATAFNMSAYNCLVLVAADLLDQLHPHLMDQNGVFDIRRKALYQMPRLCGLATRIAFFASVRCQVFLFCFQKLVFTECRVAKISFNEHKLLCLVRIFDVAHRIIQVIFIANKGGLFRIFDIGQGFFEGISNAVDLRIRHFYFLLSLRLLLVNVS